MSDIYFYFTSSLSFAAFRHFVGVWHELSTQPTTFRIKMKIVHIVDISARVLSLYFEYMPMYTNLHKFSFANSPSNRLKSCCLVHGFYCCHSFCAAFPFLFCCSRRKLRKTLGPREREKNTKNIINVCAFRERQSILWKAL